MKTKLLSLIAIVAITFTSNSQINGYSVGQTVADFTVTDTDGNSHTLSSYTNAGKWVVLDFFFTTCGPCQQTTPIFNELHEKYGCNTGDVVCLTINTGQDNDAAVVQFEQTYGGSSAHSPAVSGDGGSGAVNSVFNPSAYPTYCLIGADMKLKNGDIWPISAVSDFESAFSSAGFNPTPAACTGGISDDYAFQNMKIYPNPANQSTTLSVDLLSSQNIDVQIYNMIGMNISSFVVNGIEGNNEFNINTSNLSRGEYLIRLNINGSLSNPIMLNVVR